MRLSGQYRVHTHRSETAITWHELYLAFSVYIRLISVSPGCTNPLGDSLFEGGSAGVVFRQFSKVVARIPGFTPRKNCAARHDSVK
jgi:hypothetical protein